VAKTRSPEQSQFYLSLFDMLTGSLTQRWVTKGKRIGMSVSCSESWLCNVMPERVQLRHLNRYTGLRLDFQR